jgi:catechol 2,3-dioxygenase-like lactoylglutathione lyase family enzyme
MPGQIDAVGLIVTDLERSVRFYRLLGAPFPEGAEQSGHGHAEAVLAGGFRLLLDTEAGIRQFDPAWTPPAGEPRASVAFRCTTPTEVDELFVSATAAGGRAHMAPWDALWGQRYAQLRDPDGNGVDLYADLASASAEAANPRAAELARQFELTQTRFVDLVESLTDAQWKMVGSNFPQRLNDEDEGRTVGVIAYHVAVSGPWILDRIEAMLQGRQLTPPDIRAINAQHATEHADVSRDEVLGVLRRTLPTILARVRAIPDDQLDQSRDSPAGPMSVAQRLERVLIGHVEVHRGSIEAAIAGGTGPA